MTPAAGPPAARGLRIAGCGLLAVLAGLMLLGSPLHRTIQLAWFDACQTVSPRRVASLPAVIVAINEKSLQELGQWPWPRTVLARLVAAVAGSDAAAIGLDTLMPEADRLTPARLAEQLPAAEQQTRLRLLALPDNDAVLAATIAKSPVVLGIAGTPEPTTMALRAAPFRVVGREPRPRVRQFGGVLTSIAPLDRAAAGHGLLSSDPEGGVIRRMPLVARIGDARRYVSAADVLHGRVAPERLQRKLVLIGATGLGLMDYQTVATGERLPGVEVHAQLLESIFDRTTLQRPEWAGTAELLLLLAAGALLIWAVPALPPRRALAVGLGSPLLVAATAFGLFLRARLLFDAANPGANLVLLFGALLALTLIDAAQRQKLLEREVQRQREASAGTCTTSSRSARTACSS